MISVNNLTVKYKSGKGIFGLNFTVKEGEVFGFLGPNGAGKTTTIRSLMGFMPADAGSCKIGGIDCWSGAKDIKEFLGYISGEIAFFDNMTGNEFLKFLTDMRGKKDGGRQAQLTEYFQLDARGSIRRMSKGMKQKLGIIAAFMHDSKVLILDEPTSGLDPLMQNKFVQLVLEEKKRGKTVLMSSHSFDEIDKTCDRAGIIKDGKMQAVESISTLKASQKKIYSVVFDKKADMQSLKEQGFELKNEYENTAEISIVGEADALIKALAKYRVISLDRKSQDLESVFMQYYDNREEAE